ncbi:MAG: hypothetical protein IPO22_09010 [Anaerolineales bacterium]|jgi:hypothetical protein|nr:hypothetical protein [Anaerolineales bacterium]
MFDNLREEVSAKPFLDEEEAKFQPAAGTESAGNRKPTRILGMTAVQRFVIVFMLFLTVCIIGASFLFVMGKIAI